MEKYDGKVELSLKQRYELRKMLEEELKNVPEGMRKKLPKDLLEQLLFETNVSILSAANLERFDIDCENFRSAKFPVWSGKFLSRLDLSEVSFENVVWCLEMLLNYFRNLGYNVDEFYKLYHRNMSEDRFDKNMKDIDDIFSRGSNSSDESYDCRVVYANTNAQIDFASAFCLINNAGGIVVDRCIYDCDFENVNLNGSGIEFVRSIYNSNFAGANFEGEVIDCSKTVFSNCNFGRTRLNFCCDLTNGAHLFKFKESKINGCFINGKPTTVERDDEKIESISRASNDLFNSYVEAIKNAELVSAEEGRRVKH